MTDQYLDIVFDGPPGPESGRFIEVENEQGHSIGTGDWIPENENNPEAGLWRLRLKIFPGLNGLASRINQTARDHGFWEEDRNMGEMIALMHSELSEALEEHRGDGAIFYISPEGKPEGVAVEFADCMIRILDTMHSLGVDINLVVEAKMAYNDSRPHKHGKKY